MLTVLPDNVTNETVVVYVIVIPVESPVRQFSVGGKLNVFNSPIFRV
jgi:hypothetical protein